MNMNMIQKVVFTVVMLLISLNTYALFAYKNLLELEKASNKVQLEALNTQIYDLSLYAVYNFEQINIENASNKILLKSLNTQIYDLSRYNIYQLENINIEIENLAKNQEFMNSHLIQNQQKIISQLADPTFQAQIADYISTISSLP